MSKLTVIQTGGSEDCVAMTKIPEGTWFFGRYGQAKGLFLKATGVLIFMDDRTTTWTDCRDCIVEGYREVDVEIRCKKAGTMSAEELLDVCADLPDYYPPQPPRFGENG